MITGIQCNEWQLLIIFASKSDIGDYEMARKELCVFLLTTATPQPSQMLLRHMKGCPQGSRGEPGGAPGSPRRRTGAHMAAKRHYTG